MNVKDLIKKSLVKATRELGIKNINPSVEHSTLLEHGDYSTNLALIVSKRMKKSPMEIAEEIIKSIKYQVVSITYIDRVEVAKPGFINFWLSRKYLLDNMLDVTRDKNNFGRGSKMKDAKVMVEFTDPNPFKEFHIGHLYSNVVGESLCRLLESQGAIVKRVNYQGDVGLHVAKAIWGIQKSTLRLRSGREVKSQNLEEKSLEEKMKFLGDAYAQGTRAYEENEEVKKAINKLNKKIYEQDPEVQEVYQKGRKWSLDYFEKIYKRLGTQFDFYYFESEAGKVGLEYVLENLKKGIFEKSEGAVIFPGKKYDLHNRVFINSLGLPTYEAKELGLAPTKYKDFPYDLSVIVTGNEINEYFKVLLKALSLINPDLAEKTRHIGHGMVRLPSGKMSSRTGDVVTGEWLLDEAKKRIKENYKDMEEHVAEQVAIGAVKYALLKSGIGKDITFNFKESINLEGDSGPYIQYTYARTQSVVRKFETPRPRQAKRGGQISKSETNTKYKILNTKYDLAPEELALLRMLHRFSEIVEEATSRYTPHMLCQYLFSLAQEFNLFYQKHQILESEQQEFRVGLTQAVSHVLKNGLYLLGIQAPERM